MDRRYWFVGLVLVAGIFTSHQFYNFTRANDAAQARLGFEEKAADRLEYIKYSIISKQAGVRSLVAHFDSSKNVDRKKFKTFARSALKHFPSVQALQWIPKVPASDRPAFEAMAREEGFEDFRFTERSDDGKTIAAMPRDEYFPVYFAESFEENEAALGFDIGSHPILRAAMRKARDGNKLIASEKIELIQGGDGIFIFAPVYSVDLLNETVYQRRQNLRGFAVGVLNVEKMVESTFRKRRTLHNPAGIDIYLYDEDAPSSQRFLYHHRSRTRADTKESFLTRAEVETGPHVNQSFLVGNRTWNLIAKPVRSDFGLNHSVMAVGAALLPALFAMVLAAYLHMLFSQSRRLENEITERRRAEDELRKSDMLFRAAFDQSAVGMAIRNVGPYDSRWTRVNQKFCDVFGYTEDEMSQMTSIDVSPPGEKHIAVEFNERILRGEISSYSREKRYVRKGGDFFWSKIWLSPILGPDGVPTQIIQVIEDITERKLAEEDRSRALLEAKQANQAKSAFLAAMSHDLRTPLNAILGFADILRHQYLGPIDEKYQEYAADIHSSGEHLLQMVNDILDLSTIEAGKQTLVKEKLSALDVVMESERIVEEKARSSGINLVTEAPQDLPPIYADRRAIKQILLNLLSNAIKFTPEGGSVTISVKASTIETTFKIIDTGRGIVADDLPGLTDPFTKTKDDPYLSEKGWGLGLSITKSLINLHNGTLDIKSEVGRGTTVTVTLPNGAP